MSGNKDSRRITKVHYDEKRVKITYEQFHGGDDWDQFQMSCTEEPRPAFREALAALAPHVAKICECTKTWAQDLSVRGVALSHKHDVMGVVVTAAKPLRMTPAPMTINTPHLAEDSYTDNGEDGNPTMPKAMLDDLMNVIDEAHAYIDGQRAQMQMFTDDN